jgi:hypothetical protein
VPGALAIGAGHPTFEASPPDETSTEPFHATTILSVRRGGRVVRDGDGQVTPGNTVVKANAKKIGGPTSAHQARFSDTSR